MKKWKTKRSRKYYFCMLDPNRRDPTWERKQEERKIEYYISVLEGKDISAKKLWNGQEMSDAIYDGYLTNNRIKKWLRENS